MDLSDLNPEIIEALTPGEKEAIHKIFEEIQTTGSSSLYDDMLNEDYEEIPVDIDTFIENDEYIGKITQQGTTIYPYWRKMLRQIFDPNHNYNEVIFTGAIGLGKTTIAITAMAYILYQLLCLKNPQQFYGLQGNSKIVLAFFNVNLDLSYGVAFKKLQSMLMESPWFLKHGSVVGREEKNKRYYPDKGIEFKVGSQDTHGLGQDIFCVDGDTRIITEEGIVRIKDVEGKILSVLSVDNDGKIVLSNKCQVVKTKEVTELYEITFDNNFTLKCTGEHRLRLSTGEYKQVKDLKIGDDIMDGTYDVKPKGKRNYVKLTSIALIDLLASMQKVSNKYNNNCCTLTMLTNDVNRSLRCCEKYKHNCYECLRLYLQEDK